MYTAKHTMLYKHKVHSGEAHVFYMDIRAGGKGYDEFVRPRHRAGRREILIAGECRRSPRKTAS